MSLRYQFEGQSEDCAADIPDQVLVMGAVQVEEIVRIIEEEEGAELGVGFIMKYWDYNTKAYRRAKPKAMITADPEMQLRIKPGENKEAQAPLPKTRTSDAIMQQNEELKHQIDMMYATQGALESTLIAKGIAANPNIVNMNRPRGNSGHPNFEQMHSMQTPSTRMMLGHQQPQYPQTPATNLYGMQSVESVENYQEEPIDDLDVLPLPEFAMKPSMKRRKKQISNELDIVIFHSAPLVHFKNTSTIPMQDSELDFDSERNTIMNTLQNTGIGVNFRFDAATIENFSDVLDFNPTIIHISCHGNYDPDNAMQFYLAFEQSQKLGVLEKLNSDMLKTLLGARQKYDGVVFVSAWYSGAIGQVFRDAGFACVICVHSDCQILDDAARIFASHFYKNIIRGHTVGEAFDQAMVIVKVQQQSLVQGCCCSHQHSVDCLWFQESRNMSSEEMCKLHTPTCNTCEFTKASGIHKVECKWANEFLSKYVPDHFPTDDELDSGLMQVCCCTTDPHNEGLKFSMLCDEEFKEKRLFTQKQSSEIENVMPLPEDRRPPYVNKTIIGRHVDIQNIVEILQSNSGKKNIIYVTGACGIGKSVVTKLAAMYAFERRVFQDGVLYIDLRHKTNAESIYEGIANCLCFRRKMNNMELNRWVDKQQLLVILDNVTALIKESEAEFKEKIQSFVQFTTNPKLLIVTDDAPHHTQFASNVIKLEELQVPEWTKMIKSMVSDEWRRQEIAENEDALRKVMGGNPGEVEQMIPLLEEKSIEKFILERQRQVRSKRPTLTISSVLNMLPEHDPNALPFFQLLLAFPVGLLESDIELLWETKDYNWREIMQFLIVGKGESKRQWLVDTGDSGKIKEQLYIGSEKFKAPVQELPSARFENDTVRNEAISYLSALARGILRALMTPEYETGIEIDSQHINFNASLWVGIWSDLNESWSKKICEKIGNSYPVERFQLLEMNFWYYIRQFTETPPILKEAEADALQELMICVISIFILQCDYDKAIEFATEAEKCSVVIDLPRTTPIIQLSIAGIKMLQKQTVHAREFCTRAQNRFSKENHEGRGECYLLLAQIAAVNRQNSDTLPEESINDQHPDLKMRRSNTIVPRSNTLSIELENVVDDYYDLAYKHFTRAVADFGVARQLILKSEFLVDNPKQLATYIGLVKNFLKQAKTICEKYNDKIWELRCLITYGKYFKLTKPPEWNKAREKFLAAKKLSKENKDRKQEIIIKDQLQKINQKIRTSSSNNISILIGNPLVKISVFKEAQSIGPICRSHNSKHNSYILDAMSKCNKVVNVKVEYLNKNALRMVDNFSKILILDSDVFDPNHLVVEGENSEAEFIPVEKIKKELGHDFLGVEVVIFAIPQSVRLAEYFYRELKVPHAIAFNFPSINQSEEHGTLNLLTRKVVINFYTTFYTKLLQTFTVKIAVEQAEKSIKKDIQKLSEIYEQEGIDVQNLDKFGPILIDSDAWSHKQSVFKDREVSLYSNIETLIFGKVLNVSKSLPPNNLKPIDGFLSGRQVEMYQAIQAVSSTPIVQVISETGLGKTHFLYVLAHYVHMRNYFPKGVFYFDLKECHTMGQANQKLDSAGISTESDELLLILDNWDKLIKENSASFTTMLHFYVEECGFKILLSSQEELLKKRATEETKTTEIYLDKLSDLESATLLVSNTLPLKKSDITQEETDESLLQLLANSAAIKACKGNPARLVKMAEDLYNESFQDITLKYTTVNNLLTIGFGKGFGFQRIMPKRNSKAYCEIGENEINPRKTPQLQSSRTQEKEYAKFKKRVNIKEAAKNMVNSTQFSRGLLRGMFGFQQGIANNEKVHFEKVREESFEESLSESSLNDITVQDPSVQRRATIHTSSPTFDSSQPVDDRVEKEQEKGFNIFTSELIRGIREQKRIIAEKEEEEKKKSGDSMGSKTNHPRTNQDPKRKKSSKPYNFDRLLGKSQFMRKNVKQVLDHEEISTAGRQRSGFDQRLSKSNMLIKLVKAQLEQEEIESYGRLVEEGSGFDKRLSKSNMLIKLVKAQLDSEEERIDSSQGKKQKHVSFDVGLSKSSIMNKLVNEVRQNYPHQDEEQKFSDVSSISSRSENMQNPEKDITWQEELPLKGNQHIEEQEGRPLQRNPQVEQKRVSFVSGLSQSSIMKNIVSQLQNSEQPSRERDKLEQIILSCLDKNMTRIQMIASLQQKIQELQEEETWEDQTIKSEDKEPVVFETEESDVPVIRDIPNLPTALSIETIDDITVSPTELRQISDIPPLQMPSRAFSTAEPAIIAPEGVLSFQRHAYSIREPSELSSSYSSRYARDDAPSYSSRVARDVGPSFSSRFEREVGPAYSSGVEGVLSPSYVRRLENEVSPADYSRAARILSPSYVRSLATEVSSSYSNISDRSSNSQTSRDHREPNPYISPRISALSPKANHNFADLKDNIKSQIAYIRDRSAETIERDHETWDRTRPLPSQPANLRPSYSSQNLSRMHTPKEESKQILNRNLNAKVTTSSIGQHLLRMHSPNIEKDRTNLWNPTSPSINNRNISNSRNITNLGSPRFHHADSTPSASSRSFLSMITPREGTNRMTSPRETTRTASREVTNPKRLWNQDSSTSRRGESAGANTNKILKKMELLSKSKIKKTNRWLGFMNNSDK